jgi:hypothetical protein
MTAFTPRLMSCVSLVVSVVLASVTVVAQQPPLSQRQGGPPPLPFELPADGDVWTALQSDDIMQKEVVIYRAALLVPAESLRLHTDTVKAISKEVVRMMNDVHARFMKDPLSVNEGNSRSEYVTDLAMLLINSRDPAAIDGLAAVAPLALKDFGEAAVPTLVAVARMEPEDEGGHSADALDALGRILVGQGNMLLPDSKAAIRQVAAQRLESAKGNEEWRILGEAAYLAVATGDLQLRKQVEDIVDNNAEFARRGMDRDSQDRVSQYARWALDKFR